MDAMRLMGAADFVEIGIPKGPAVKIAYCLQAGRPPPGAALSTEITARKFLTALGLTKVCCCTYSLNTTSLLAAQSILLCYCYCGNAALTRLLAALLAAVQSTLL
jgi:hypothetical protein